MSSLQAQTAWDKLDPESTRMGGYLGAPVVAVGGGETFPSLNRRLGSEFAKFSLNEERDESGFVLLSFECTWI